MTMGELHSWRSLWTLSQGSANRWYSWCPWKPFSTENLILLYSKQRNMKWLEVMDVDEPALPLLKKNKRVQAGMFKNARKLALYPENRETLNLSGYFVENTAERLEELIVHCNFMSDSRNAIESRDLNDSATAPGLVSRSARRCSMCFAPRRRRLRCYTHCPFSIKKPQHSSGL